MSSYISSPPPFLKHSLMCFYRCGGILRQSIMFACGGTVAKRALRKQCKRWATAGLLDQPFNPVTLSLRQTACYRSFHYVFKQQIALKVRKASHVQRCSDQPVVTLLLSDVQISEDSWKTEKRVSVIGDDVEKRSECSLVQKLWLWHRPGRLQGSELTVMWRDAENLALCVELCVCSAGEVRNKYCTCLIGGWFYPGGKLLLYW